MITERFRGRTFWLGGLACPVVGIGDDIVFVKVGHVEVPLTPDQLEAHGAEETWPIVLVIDGQEFHVGHATKPLAETLNAEAAKSGHLELRDFLPIGLGD